jgi:MFS family permease
VALTAGLGRPFWTVWTAATVSTLGDGIRYVAFPLLAASLTRDPRAVALVSAAGYLPWAVFGLVSGAVVDRVDRRQLMYRIDFGRAALVGGFAVLVAEQQAPVVALATVSFVLGSAETLFDNAASAILPTLVAEQGLERANSWTMVSQNVMSTLIGAPLGSLLFGLAHEVPMIADAATFVFAAALVAAVRGHYVARTTAATTRVRTDVADGLRWLWQHRLLRTLCALVAIQNVGLAAGEAVLVLYVYEVLHLNSFGYSLLLAALAVGGVAGALLGPSLRARLGLVSALTIAAAALTGGLALAGATSSVAAAAIGLALFGAGISVWSIITVSIRQRMVPADLLGRVTSSYRVVGLAAMPVGAALGGLLAHSFGLHAPYLAGGVLLGACTLLALPSLRVSAGAATRG